MNVFAEYFEENNITYRRNTILQFGNSWQLIGNIVLANPGSATPIVNITQESSVKLKKFYKSYRFGGIFNVENWFEFKVDSTMRFVEKIFNGEYVGNNKELNGVVQLFNIFNIRNPNLEKAVGKIEIETDFMFPSTIAKYFHDKPTYFGFSKKALKNKTLQKIAKRIFNNSSEKILSIYKKGFSDNAFYHPMYINRAYNQNHFQWYKDQVLLPLLKNA